MTNVAKRHPKDGVKRRDYVASKVQHMKDKGLIAHNKTGLGPYGGACPDHMLERLDETALTTANHIKWMR